jgi:hypothetical protein
VRNASRGQDLPPLPYVEEWAGMKPAVPPRVIMAPDTFHALRIEAQELLAGVRAAYAARKMSDADARYLLEMIKGARRFLELDDSGEEHAY